MFEGSHHYVCVWGGYTNWEKSKSVEKDVPLCFYAVCTLQSLAGLIN